MTTNLIPKLSLALIFPAFIFSLSTALHETAIQVGDSAPAQILPQNFGGKAPLLNFWATWCEPCKGELCHLTSLAATLAPEGLVAMLGQPDKALQLAYGTTQIPESYLIDRTGKVRAKYISSQDWTSPEILAQIRSVL
jgi:thiol-disulfide isomerase/thioredoxin